MPAEIDLPHVVIVGGGISGLSAAWEAARAGTVRVTLLERDNRWGGKIVTDRLTFTDAGRPVTLLLDGGPESFITRKPAAWEMAGELDLHDAVQKAGSETSGVYVLDNGLPQPVPISPGKFINSTLISTRAKLRLLVEPRVPARRDMDDESPADFVSRRLGREWRLGKAFTEYCVGIKPTQRDGVYAIFFSHHKLAEIDLTQQTQRIQCVTYVPEDL